MCRCLSVAEMKINECKHSTAASELSSPDSGSDTAACAIDCRAGKRTFAKIDVTHQGIGGLVSIVSYGHLSLNVLVSVFNVIALVGTFNQEKALVGAFSAIVKL